MSNRYLVVYDYGMGGLWAVIRAAHETDIWSKFPELKIVDERPKWMDDTEFARILDESDFELDAVPANSWLGKLSGGRNKPDYASMTVNERLSASGLMTSFGMAARARDRVAMIAILSQLELADQADTIAGTILNNPAKYGY